MTTAEMRREEGRAEGEARGRAETLIMLLTERLGPLDRSVMRRMYAADIEQLNVWTARVLRAATLNEVLA